MSKNGVIIALLAIVAVAVPVAVYVAYAAHVKERRSLRESRNSPVVKPQEKVATQVPREKIIDPATCIFKEVGSLSDAERMAVLVSAQRKTINLVNSGGSLDTPWITLCSEPMTRTEAEVLGDHLFEGLRRERGVSGLKMAVYWSKRVAEACLRNNNHAESQFYNSYHDVGGRVNGPDPRAFDDRTLYEQYKADNEGMFYGKMTAYDVDRGVLHVEVPAETMIELIFRTFTVLCDTGRESPFDRLPCLEAVRITYTDKAGQEIGGATYDFRYWSAVRGIESVPYEVSNQGLDEQLELGKKRQAKLITEKEYERQYKAHRELYDEIKSRYYQDKWVELIPLIKGFALERELPLRGKEPFF